MSLGWLFDKKKKKFMILFIQKLLKKNYYSLTASVKWLKIQFYPTGHS